jgi:ankyrin repeat protein
VLAQENPRHAADATKSIKADLSLVYKSMLQRIDSRGLKLLHWVLFAARPLTLDELRFAIAIKAGMADLDPKQDLPYPSFIELALGLLTVEGVRRIVRFSHLTIKEYLTTHSSQYFPDGHQLLAITCLTYLNFTALSSESGRARFMHHGDLYPFFHYAPFEWGHHTREAADSSQACDMALQWFLSERFSQWIELRDYRLPLYLLPSFQLPLHEACYFGLVPVTIKLLQLGHKPRVNEHDWKHRTPLHCAALGGHLGIIQTLVECRNILNVNVQDKWGDTPVHNAAFQGHTTVIEFLLQHTDIQVNLQNQRGQTPLHICAKKGHEAATQLLLHRRDILINIRDSTGQTPLHLATEWNNIQTIQSLLCHPNVDVNCRNAEGSTALTLAVERGNTEAVQILLTCDDIDTEVTKRLFLNTDVTLPQDLLLRLGLLSEALYLAAQNGDKAAVLALLCQPNLRLNSHYGCEQTTALHEAALSGRVDIVETLLHHPDINVNAVDRHRWTALMCAANKGHSDVIKILLQHPQVNVNHGDTGGWTALTEAVDEGHAEAVWLLLAHKDIDIAASRIAEPGFWDLKHADRLMTCKHTRLPLDLRLKLGL